MKKRTEIVLFVLAQVLLCSCQKVFCNGDLDGQWRVERIEYKDIGWPAVASPFVMYDFVQDLFVVKNQDFPIRETDAQKSMQFGQTGVFTHSKDTLILDFSMYENREEYDLPLIRLYIKTCGLEELKTTWKIETLNKNRLVLSGDCSTMYLKKW